MKRTQISLTEKQFRFLKQQSDQTGESVTAIIRRAIERMKRGDRGLAEEAQLSTRAPLRGK